MGARGSTPARRSRLHHFELRALRRWCPGGGTGLLLAGLGAAGAIAAAVVRPGFAKAAASQVWPAFALVTGLLLVGLVANDDGLFGWAGGLLFSIGRPGRSAGHKWLFAVAMCLVAIVSAAVNLDTAAAFLTPVLVYGARRRRISDAAFLYGSILVCNAGSLLLPGSNLTNLIVLGHLHLAGQDFASRMGPAWVAAVVVTATVTGLLERRSLGADHPSPADIAGPEERPGAGPTPLARRGPPGAIGSVSVAAALVLMLVLHSPALPVLAVGLVGVTLHFVLCRSAPRGDSRPGTPAAGVLTQLAKAVGPDVLAGLFGIAVALGAAGRAWAGPGIMLAHLGGWATAGVAAAATVALNNLPAASLLAARTPPHPFALLAGLDLGPNLFVTGSLSWVLWLRSARVAGAEPSLARASRAGVPSGVLGLAAALAAMSWIR